MATTMDISNTIVDWKITRPSKYWTNRNARIAMMMLTIKFIQFLLIYYILVAMLNRAGRLVVAIASQATGLLGNKLPVERPQEPL